MDSVNGKQVDIRPFDNLEFTKSEGQIRTLGVDSNGPDAQLVLRFHGLVEGMRGGTGLGRSLMPSLLESMLAQRRIALLWGAVVYATVLVLGILRFLRIEK